MENKLQATIDIGSHSCILLIAAFEDAPAAAPAESANLEKVETPAEAPANSETPAESSEAPVAPRKILVPKLQKVEVCRLGEDIYEHGKITPERIQELVNIMTKFRMDLHALGADLKAVAMTEAMRKATNPDEVIEAVEKAVWVKPRVITGEEEGKLTYRSVKEWHGEGNVTIDIGGGSTELSNGETTFSIPVGALKMFKAMGPIPGPEYKKFIKETFKDLSFKGMTKKPVYLIGGTGTALAMVFLNSQTFDYKAIEGLEISLADLEAVTTRITNLSKELRAMLPGLGNGRHEVIICGLFWLRSLLEKLRVETFKISTAGLRFGLLYPPEKEPEPKPKKRPAFLKKTDATSETAIPEQVGDGK
ncbi:Ppx/GppA phosphatase [Fibrobacter succinogenes subsp. succinogenes S85]|uniref:Ppx/GppA phosphatase n=1 Tax=Fibrobacter succinogenes (strain ATCC 19169 / S85) TaxID=59374 RepID=A0ABM5LJS0_FIBSS|nr:phosphatase [Fibrobacter succinogenes]ACX75762.1 Ppx/GppA phosphatase [Fibrobacter succinogenes subsp. succinogenes S85]